ncbi:MAG: translational GTPase TypA [Rickettsiales bacterium]
MTASAFRNIAIIAHVDHGKTTLIDQMFRQSGTFRDNQAVEERAMDSNALERERGITILAKCTSMKWKNCTVQVIDTPGHADFGGEVERVLAMTGGAVLLVDAQEGPMPQTKFVLHKALQKGLRVIVVVNKIDKPFADPEKAVNDVFDLFVSLGASDEQLDFPLLYASGRDGWCVRNLENDKRENLAPLFDSIVENIKPLPVDENAPFAMMATILTADPYLGRCLTGLVAAGKATANMQVKAMDLNGKTVEQGRLTKLYAYEGLTKKPVDFAVAGQIICVAGLEKASVADTICSPERVEPLQSTPVDPPTMSVFVRVNDSPYAGKDGDKLTSRMIRDRLMKEAETNVAIEVKETDGDSYEVCGRGELQLGVLIETMRREGYEMTVSRPRVIFKEENGQRHEPYEEVVADVDEEFSGAVIEKLQLRKGQLKDMSNAVNGRQRLVFYVPSRGMIGYRGEFLTDTKGTGILAGVFSHYGPYAGPVAGRRNGALIAIGKGEAVAYALFNIQPRGELFVDPQDEVYDGMVVGLHSRDNDLSVNVLKGKQLTNIRAAGTDEAIRLTPPRRLTLEEMLTVINDDELVEVTPKRFRMRKYYLDPNERKRYERTQEKA